MDGVNGGDELILEVAGPVLTVRLNRPQSHNAMTPAMIAQLTAVFHHIDQHEQTYIVVEVVVGMGRRRS